VLSAINRVFSEQQVNIAAQYLQTNAKVGYVVIDVETEGEEATHLLKRSLDEVPGTLRTRVLY
jgi:D-3-phosphoglycerate dehydrogenase